MSHEHDDGTLASEKALKGAGLLCWECGAREFIHKGLCFNCALARGRRGLSLEEGGSVLGGRQPTANRGDWSFVIEPITTEEAMPPAVPPARYVINGLECRKVIEAVTSRYKPEVGFYVGNAIKYLWRAPVKGDMKGDLNKAIDNIRHALEALG